MKSTAWCLCCKLMLPFYRLRKWGWRIGDGDSCMRGWMGMGTILKLVEGIGVGMGIRVLGTVGDGYKYLSPCSFLTYKVSVNLRSVVLLEISFDKKCVTYNHPLSPPPATHLARFHTADPQLCWGITPVTLCVSFLVSLFHHTTVTAIHYKLEIEKRRNKNKYKH